MTIRSDLIIVVMTLIFYHENPLEITVYCCSEAKTKYNALLQIIKST